MKLSHLIQTSLSALDGRRSRSAGFQPAVSPTSSRPGVVSSNASVPINTSQAGRPAIQQI